ncbi:hypothetical protein [Arthrobacter sp. ISL-28]|uniref:hypothetical protein n=1 Tax=Arthrobacter sp. ISL-28 TaxID=2819108 RepID=UPI001BEA69A2|nr:hypothetical protein [Arthrobacter sp. ISL-28]MBT2519619.1 hypothetical protein [Arthrobacter sp. ISL-28]
MAADEELEVRSCVELNVGDDIEAWHRGRLVHRGTVSSTFEQIDLFWIIDARTGARRLLDLEQLSVRRVPAGKPGGAVGQSSAAGQLKPAAVGKTEPAVGMPADVVGKTERAAVGMPKPAPSLRHIVFVEAPTPVR